MAKRSRVSKKEIDEALADAKRLEKEAEVTDRISLEMEHEEFLQESERLKRIIKTLKKK